MSRIKEVRQTTVKKGDGFIHIETDGCIVNIRPGLKNCEGLGVTSVEVIADGKCDCDPVEWMIDDGNPPGWKMHSQIRVVRRLYEPKK